MQARFLGVMSTRTTVGRALCAVFLAAGLVTAALAQSAAPVADKADPVAAPAADTAGKGPPAGFVAPADPKPGETNAERARSQPGNNAPMWSAVRDSGTQPGVISLPGAEKGVLVQQFLQYPGSRFTTAGEAWRQVRNDWIIPYGGAVLLFAVLALASYYWRRGPIGHATNEGPAAIERFTPFERITHWINATCFVILAISGVVMAFGKFVLLPILGGTLFGWLTYALKTAHNFAGPVFVVSVIVVIAIFLKDNLAKAADFVWLRNAGGMFSGKEYPSHRFNGAEKVLFWIGVCLLGLSASASGLVLNGLIPGLGVTRVEMQIAHMVHAITAVLMLALIIGHIYMGTIGTRGALQAMKTGWVDEEWAREHHRLWYDDVKTGRLAAKRSQESPPAVGAASARA
jgi:formate dehydrogenase subunit gamma